MHHFFVEPEDIDRDRVIITGDDVQHITRSLRLGSGDQITVADGAGTTYLVEIQHTDEKVVEGDIINELERKVEPDLEVTLVQGLPKRKKKMDLIVQKSTELGVSRIVPLLTERTVVKLTADKAERRQERWQKIAREAAKQCQRSRIPKVKPVKEFSQLEAAETLQADLALIPWAEETSYSWRQVINEGQPQSISVVVGPEGGFTPQEIDQAQEWGLKPVSLGPRILRAETAGIASVTMALYEAGDLGG